MFHKQVLLRIQPFLWASRLFRREITMIIFKIQAWIIKSFRLSRRCYHFPFRLSWGPQCSPCLSTATLPLWTLYSPQLRSSLSLHQNTSVLGLKGARGFDKGPTYYLFMSDLLLHVKLEGTWCRDKEQTDSEAAARRGASDLFLGPWVPTSKIRGLH